MPNKLPGFQNPKLWDYIAVNAENDIEAGGWYSSFGGTPFSSEEMEQYKENTFTKLQPYLSKDKTVIEIGCASGLTMFQLAPYVSKYIGTDMSKENLVRDETRIQNDSRYNNIVLKQCFANEVAEVLDTKADIIIANSVCQYFPDIQYFENVISMCLSLLKSGGVLYIGDLLDKDLLPVLIQELKDWQRQNPGSKKVKIDRSDELWISRSYFDDIRTKYGAIANVEISDKTGKIPNELTKYRYDVILSIQ